MVLACLANFETNGALAPAFGVEGSKNAEIVKGRLTVHVTVSASSPCLVSPVPIQLAELTAITVTYIGC